MWTIVMKVSHTFGWTAVALILHETDSIKFWKHSSETLVHFDVIASHSHSRIFLAAHPCESISSFLKTQTSLSGIIDRAL